MGDYPVQQDKTICYNEQKDQPVIAAGSQVAIGRYNGSDDGQCTAGSRY